MSGREYCKLPIHIEIDIYQIDHVDEYVSILSWATDISIEMIDSKHYFVSDLINLLNGSRCISAYFFLNFEMKTETRLEAKIVMHDLCNFQNEDAFYINNF